jgi:hypothetical protein
VGDAVQDERFPDHVPVTAQPGFPEPVRDDRHIRPFFLFSEEGSSQYRPHPEHVEVIRRRLEHRHLERVAQSRDRRSHPVFSREAGENRLPLAVEHEARRGHREVIRPVLGPGVEMEDARRILEGQPLQEQVVDQAKNRRVQADPEHERKYRQECELRRFAQLPQSETKVSHHKRDGLMWTTLPQSLDAPTGTLDSINKRRRVRIQSPKGYSCS